MKYIEIPPSPINNYELVNYTDFVQQICKQGYAVDQPNHYI